MLEWFRAVALGDAHEGLSSRLVVHEGMHTLVQPW